jgi:preprotein translocase subunit SecG
MNVLYYLLISLHVLACLFLIAVVLLQQGKGQDLASAFGGGGTQTAFGPRGSATVLSRATTILAGVFVVTSLALSVVQPGGSSVLDRVPGALATPAPAATAAPSEAAAPVEGEATEPAPAEATPAGSAPEATPPTE